MVLLKLRDFWQPFMRWIRFLMTGGVRFYFMHFLNSSFRANLQVPDWQEHWFSEKIAIVLSLIG